MSILLFPGRATGKETSDGTVACSSTTSTLATLSAALKLLLTGTMNTEHQDQVTHKLKAQVTHLVLLLSSLVVQPLLRQRQQEAATVTDGEQRNTETYLAAPCSKNTLAQRAVWKHKLKQTRSSRQRERGRAASSFRPGRFSSA